MHMIMLGNKDIDEDNDSIYDKYQFLIEFKDYFWEFEDKDLLWEGLNAIIVRHPTENDLVIKIAKPWKTDKLEPKYENHQKNNK